jgi:predicted anti-sigma-YlaC factor YlaD
MSCEAYRQLISAYLDDSLDEVRRTGFRAHLRSCDRCREFAIGEDPTLALVLDEPTPPESERIEACVTAVMAGIRRERLERRLRPSRRPWLAAAAAVVIAVVAASWWYLAPSATDVPAAVQADVVADSEDGTTVDTEAPLRVEPPRVEVDMTQEEVRVYRYAIGDDDSTGAVFIVNPAMEL